MSNEGGRPRSRTMVGIDPYNAYTRLGVSPLLPTDDIKELINRRRKDLMRKRRARGDQQFGAEEAAMTDLQAIEDEIGSPRARARYDRANPQNELLTVQPAEADLRLDPGHRAGLATAWLVEELGREAMLPSPESTALWAPKGLDPDLLAFLAGFDVGDIPAEPADLPDLAELGRLARSRHDHPGASGDGPDVGPASRLAGGGSPDG